MINPEYIKLKDGEWIKISMNDTPYLYNADTNMSLNILVENKNGKIYTS